MGGSQQNPSKEINEPSSERGQDFGGVGDYVVPAPSTPKPTGMSYYEEVYLERWPSMSKWRSRTRIMVVLDMTFSWMFIGFCASFLTKVSLTLSLYPRESQWSIKTAEYASTMLGTLWVILFGAILKKLVGTWAGLKLLQAVSFAQRRDQAEELSKIWRLISVISLIICPVIIVTFCAALYWVPPTNQEFLVFSASFTIILGYGWYWRMLSYYVVYRFLKEFRMLNL